ncbi:MAG: hypothetical protein COB15_00950 [Flavobacteriales bacterium]|nr:MAG: hypothetical protein COB15_00950 [Flavobacteriales bacterium]
MSQQNMEYQGLNKNSNPLHLTKQSVNSNHKRLDEWLLESTLSQINSSQKTIELQNVKSGVYFVQLTIDNITISRKIFINK